MKKFWNYYTDYLGRTILHPQYFMNKYNREGKNIANKYSVNNI